MNEQRPVNGRSAAVQLAQVINSLGCIEIRRAIASPDGKFVSFEARDVDGQMWLALLPEFLRDIRGRGLRYHICRHYFLDDNGRMDNHIYMRFSARDTIKACLNVGNSFLRARTRVLQSRGQVEVRHPVPVQTVHPHDPAPQVHQPPEEMKARFDLPDSDSAAVARQQMQGGQQRDFSVREVYSGVSEDGQPISVTEAPLPWLENPEQRSESSRGARSVLRSAPRR